MTPLARALATSSTIRSAPAEFAQGSAAVLDNGLARYEEAVEAGRAATANAIDSRAGLHAALASR